MIDVDPFLRDELDRLTPEPSHEPDWHEILAAATPQPSRRRTRPRVAVVLAAAALALAVIAVSPLGAAVERRVADGFGWLTGDEPGAPAPAAEQERVVRQDERAWARFPERPRLRRLVHAERAGATYDLYGFRTGDNVCLRLVITGLPGGPMLACSPLAQLRASNDPAIPLIVDALVHADPHGRATPAGTFPRPKASVSFGLAEASVERIVLAREDGPVEALVANNAFMAIRTNPELRARTTSAVAIGRDGRERAIPVAPPLDEPTNAKAAPLGPAKVERVIPDPHIAWIERREPRGSDPPAGIDPLRPGGFVRVIQPDPQDFIRVLAGAGRIKHIPAGMPGNEPNQICHGVVTRGGVGVGCIARSHAFDEGPILGGGPMMSGAGTQTAILAGLAADGVTRMELFLATGDRRPVPLRDNAFAIRAPRAKFPVRVVAYDADGLVVGVQTWKRG